MTSWRMIRKLKSFDGELIKLNEQKEGTELFKLIKSMRFYFSQKCEREKLPLCKWFVDAVLKWAWSRCGSEESAKKYFQIMNYWTQYSKKIDLGQQAETKFDDINKLISSLRERKYSQRTVRTFIQVLRSWFGWLFERDLIKRMPITKSHIKSCPVDHQIIKKGNQIRQALTEEEAQAVANWALNQTDPRCGLSVMLQMISGLRSCEVTRIQNRHIFEKNGITTLTVLGKGNRSRVIILEKAVCDALARYRKGQLVKETSLLFLNKRGRISTRTVQRWAKMAAKAIGREKDISSHDLRRTAITLQVDHGANLSDAQEFAGHSSIEQTKRAYVVRRKRPVITSGISGFKEHQINGVIQQNHSGRQSDQRSWT